ncbi:MAG: hypothetical protein C0626_05100 [Arcobacter sp.]|uniref:hypothetical protein n=1 Tax=uncultured Arcobacter sp. TaxID=165434 RepID=UPI000CC7E95B|nr:hypothetical protein [uncultured Arcobacter sp.]PLY10362.1 MAG: hypothetical protein C0626_05100 [Arcobacter sp.]
MQVSRTATKEDFNHLRIDDIKQPISESRFDALLEKLQINNLSEDEKDFFQSIVEDRMVTEEEFSTLTYEQTKKIKQFTSRSDLEGNYIADSSIGFEKLSMAPLLSAQNISDDEEYNEAIFNTFKKLNLSQDDGISMLNELGGYINQEEKIIFEDSLTDEQYDSGIRYKTYIGLDMKELVSKRLEELNQGLLETSDEDVKSDYKNMIYVYREIETQYNNIQDKNRVENEAQLEQYTRNTKPNPLYNADVVELYNNITHEYEEKEKKEFDELMDKLDISNLNNREKELFRTILEDKEISNIEMDKLSYEEMKKINQFIFKKDEKGEIIDDTLIRTNSRINALLRTTELTDDETFNQVLFNTVKSMNDIYEINNFLNPILNLISEKFTAFDEVNSINFITEDMNKVLDELIKTFDEHYQETEYDEIKEHYLSVINKYQDLKEQYNKTTIDS